MTHEAGLSLDMLQGYQIRNEDPNGLILTVKT